MNWKIEIKPSAEKQYLKLDKTTKQRIKKALQELEQNANPLLHQSVRQLTGRLKGDYRIRIGDWRILFTPDRVANIIYIYAILHRGDAY